MITILISLKMYIRYHTKPYTIINSLSRLRFSVSQLLITNWLQFPIEIKLGIKNESQWVSPYSPNITFCRSASQSLMISPYASFHQSQVIQNSHCPYMLGNLGQFSLEINSDNYGKATFHGSQVNAFGVSAYSIFFGLYQLRHRAGLKYNIYEIMGRGTKDNSNWMKNLVMDPTKRNIKLNQIVIPGSHDSGMIINRFSFIKRLTENQYDDIFGQLVCGIRYFDLRFTIKNDQYHIYHGNNYIAETGISLKSVIADVNSFLEYYGKQQTIIFNVSRIRGCVCSKKRVGLASQMMTKINNAAKISDFSHNIAEQEIQNLQGKVLILFADQDFDQLNSQYLRIKQLKGQSVSPSHNQSNYLNVYDHYSNTNVIEEMIADQNKKLCNFGGLGQKYLFLYSFTLTVQSQLRLSLQHYSIQLLGNISRARLPIELHRMKLGHLPIPNIIYYDFIDSWSCSAIIKLNYR